jgi:hypothetical protein
MSGADGQMEVCLIDMVLCLLFSIYSLVRPDWESHPTVKPDFIADNLMNAVTTILGNPLVD